jgi:ABC-type branched-subunit amino acid transport system substrate-binding protein
VTVPSPARSRAGSLKSSLTAGVEILKVERVPGDAVDVTRPLAALRATHAAALVLVASPRLVGVVAPQLPSAWPKARVFGFDTLDPEGLNREAREALEGAVFIASDYALVGAARDSFETRYERAYGEPPTRMAVRGYLAGLAVARGIDGGSLNAAMLRESLRAQVYDSGEGRTFRSLRPQIPAEPEALLIHEGKAAPAVARVRP